MSGLFIKTSSGTSSIKFYKKTNAGHIECPVYIKTSNGIKRLDEVETQINKKGVDVNE